MSKYRDYLRKRPTYGQMINEIERKQPRFKYPDRTATFMRNGHYLSQFDGDLSFINLEEQENNIAKEQLLQQELKKTARETNQTHRELQASAKTSRVSSSLPSDAGTLYDDIDEIDDAQERLFLIERVRRELNADRNKQFLQDIQDDATSAYAGFQSVPDSPRVYNIATPPNKSSKPSTPRGDELASSSTSKQKYAIKPVYGINAVEIPKTEGTAKSRAKPPKKVRAPSDVTLRNRRIRLNEKTPQPQTRRSLSR